MITFVHCVDCADAIEEGRLLIGITKLDDIFRSSSHDTREVEVTEATLKSKVQTSVVKAVPQGKKMLEDNIIAISGSWALAASMLANSAIDPKEKRLKHAQGVLAMYPYVDLPGGQGQSQEELISALDRNAVVTMLESVSGFVCLKQQ